MDFIIGGVIGAAAQVLLGLYCHKNECFQQPWASLQVTQVERVLDTKLCGQQVAKSLIKKAFHDHWIDSQAQKPLIMYFYGPVGKKKCHYHSFRTQLEMILF